MILQMSMKESSSSRTLNGLFLILSSPILLPFKHLPSNISIGLEFKKMGQVKTGTYGPSSQVYFRIVLLPWQMHSWGFR